MAIRNNPEIGLEIGSYIDFHNVSHPDCHKGDSCSRIWAPSESDCPGKGGHLIMFTNGLHRGALRYLDPANLKTDNVTLPTVLHMINQ